MASFIWDRDTQEALDRSYEYNAQKQFHREAIKLCNLLVEKLLEKKRFQLKNKNLEKATWMLQTDALYTFKEAVEIVEEKRHRIVGRLLRDILETVHLVEYLNSDSPKAAKSLEEWFSDELVMHREYTEYFQNSRTGATKYFYTVICLPAMTASITTMNGRFRKPYQQFMR